jgi:hypothetical protein
MGVPPPVLVASLAGLVCALLAGAYLAHALASRPPLVRCAAFLLPSATLVLLWTTLGLLVEAPWHHWIAARLLPSAILLAGHELYTEGVAGPLNGWIYPPLFPLAMTPTMAIGDLTLAIYASALLNAAFLLVPLGLLLHRGGARGLDGWALFLLVWVASASAVPACNILAGVHCDALAVGLGLVSLSCLLGGQGEPPGRRRVFLAALFAVLSVFTKQVEVPLLAAELLFLAVVHGRRSAVGFLLAASLAGLALAGLSMAVFGTSGLLFNAFSVPMRHPFMPFGSIVPEAVREFLPWTIAYGVAAWLARGSGRRWLASDHALVFLVALFLLPTSLFARAKIGGGVNSYHAQPYLIAAVALALLVRLRQLPDRSRWLVLAAVLLVGFATLPLGRARWSYRRVAEIAENPQRRSAAFARAHPGEAWFPYLPLASLRGEGKLYHFVSGVNDRERGGYRVDEASFRAGLPANLRWVAFDPRSPRDILVRLPELSQRVELPELPGWVVFTR